MRRKTAPDTSDTPPPATNSPDEPLSAISTAISAGDDLGPIIRHAFSSSKPDHLLSSLRLFVRSKESEIEDVCRVHYQDFIRAVDDLRSLLSAVDLLKSSLSSSNSSLLSVASPLLSSLDRFLLSSTLSSNLSSALRHVILIIHVLSLCSRVNAYLLSDSPYLALKTLTQIDAKIDEIPLPTLRRMLSSHIPAIRTHIEKKTNAEFSDWMVQIRVASRNLGQVAIGRASAARQREEDLRMKQRQAEEQSRLSLRDLVYELNEDDDGEEDGELEIDLTPLYRACHIHATLGMRERFRRYYFENRKLQLTSDFQVSSMTPFLESHQTFFAQIAGFFIVEDRILRTGGGLVTRADVDSLWETAVAKMVAVLEDQFSRMMMANHLLLIKDYVSLLGVTLRRYGYTVDSLLDVLSKHRDKYHELLLSDCRKQIAEAIASDKFEQMLMRKEYEYTMNVVSFQIQTSDIMPAFPFLAPFSSTVPDCCRIVRSFIEDSVSFMSYGGQLDFYAVVKKYLDRLLVEALDSSLLKLVGSKSLSVPHAMQLAANMFVWERACDFFFRHAAQLSGIPLRIAERGRRDFPLKKSRDAVEELLLSLLEDKIDDTFQQLTYSVSWMADEPPANGNEYANEVIILLETLFSTAQQILPIQVLTRIIHGVLAHISDKIVGLFLSDSVKRFNSNAVTGIDTDLKMVESFADCRTDLFRELEGSDIPDLKLALLEARQLVNLLMTNNPENFMNAVIRERNYNKLDHKKVVTIVEKLKEPADKRFGTFGSRTIKVNPKKKSLDALIKRLKEVS